MKVKNIFMAALLMLGVTSASAQQQPDEVLVEHIFHPHWYVTVNPLGGQYTLGEIDFQKLLSYNVQASLGYDFTPYIGARLSVNAWQSKAGTEETFKRDGSVLDPRIEWSWKYVSPMADLTVNLSNMVMGNFNPTRPFQLSAFVGVGGNFAFGNDKAWEHYNRLYVDAATSNNYAKGFEPFRYIWPSKEVPYNDNPAVTDNRTKYVKDGSSKVFLNFHFGLIGDVRLNDRFALNFEVQANTLSDRYNSKRADNSDWYFNALAGLKINLGTVYHTNTRVIKHEGPKVVEKIVEKIVEKQIPCPEKEVEARVEPMRRDIFFTISSTQIDASEQAKVQELAEYMKKYPNSKIVITGYADKNTGNAVGNKSLSERRAATVADALNKQYGIDRSRMIIDSKGDTVQPFNEEVKNRVTICIAE